MTDTLHLSWIRQSPLFNTINNDYSPSIVTDTCDNIIVAFSSDTVGAPPTNGTIAKFDPKGMFLWKNTDISDIDTQVSIAYSLTSDVIYATYLDSAASIHVMKISSSGSTIWNTVPNGIQSGPSNRNFPSITVDISENIYIAYEAGSPVNIYVARIDSNTGQDIWIDHDLSMNIPTRNNLRPSISMFDTQYAYISFYYVTSTPGILRDVVAAKYDVTASLSNKLVWKVQGLSVDTSGNDLYPNLSYDSYGNLYVVYRYGNTPNYAINSFKLDTSGNVLWANKRTILSTVIEPSVTITKNNELFIFSIENQKIVIEALDPITGATLWKDTRIDLNPAGAVSAIGVNFYICRNTTADSQGNIILAYDISGGIVSGGTGSGAFDIVVAKFSTPLSGASTYPALVNGSIYRTVGRTVAYTTGAITALIEGTDLPIDKETEWSPLIAGRILRRLGRYRIIAGPRGRHLYRYEEFQLIDNSIDPASATGWICTWAASGVPPIL